MTRVALKGLARTQGPRGTDRPRDRPRRRDGERLVRPHRHDLEGVHVDLHARRTSRPTRRQRQEARRLLVERQRDRFAGAARRRSAAQPDVAAAAGAVMDLNGDSTRAKLIGKGRQGDRQRRRADVRLRRRHLAAAVQPAQARVGPLGAAARRGRDRPGHGEERALRRRRHDRRRGEQGPAQSVHRRRYREVRRRRVARRRDVRGLHDPDGAEAARRSRATRRSPSPRSRASRRTSSPASSARSSPAPPR